MNSNLVYNTTDALSSTCSTPRCPRMNIEPSNIRGLNNNSNIAFNAYRQDVHVYFLLIRINRCQQNFKFIVLG